MGIQLGATARDKITECEGVVIGRASYLTGCDQYLIAPRDAKQEARWFDEQRLDVVPHVDVITLDNSNGNGSDLPAPIK